MRTETQATSVTAAHADVLAAIRTASVKTGSDFDYLLNTAMRESGLDSQAKSKGSSATGLFQFIDRTWLGLVKRYGERHGLAGFAHAIRDAGNGHYTVDSKETREAILALRKNPQISALMAGESARQTKENLECALGREVCGGELYAAHFLGEGSAKRLIALNAKNPECLAAQEFPDAARANRNVFYREDGTPKTVREIYNWAANLADAPETSGASVVTAASSAAVPSLQAAGLRGAFAPPTDDAEGTQAEPRPADVYLGSFAARAFGSAETEPPKEAALPQQPLLLSPGVVEILASLAPAGLFFTRR